jgi:hypothetical protein
VLAIGQASHAWISGQLARAWGNHRFPRPEPWEEVCLAAEQHDVGWAEWDLEPSRDPATGLPYSFMELPLETHIELWTAAPGKLLAQSRYAALLVSMHGSRLYRRRERDRLSKRDADLVRAYLSGQERLLHELVDGLRADSATAAAADDAIVARNSQLIWIWDFISLLLCLAWAPRPVRDVPTVNRPVDLDIATADDRGRLRLSPWPFAGEGMSVRCEGRRLEGSPQSDQELRAALGAASWETIEFELVST